MKVLLPSDRRRLRLWISPLKSHVWPRRLASCRPRRLSILQDLKRYLIDLMTYLSLLLQSAAREVIESAEKEKSTAVI
jgi:hypothetical protein